jgi:RimJ/RimL family protein N-acetyltransferase
MQQTKNIYFRLVDETDIDFILTLRLNENLNKHLSKTSSNQMFQLDWIKQYKQRETLGLDYYFLVVDKQLGDLGLVRVSDIDYANKTFTWGSWILKEDRPKYAALDTAILVYEFAFNELGLFLAKFDVRNENVKVISFHKRFGSSELYSNNLNTFFELKKTTYIQLKYSKYYKYLCR